MLNHLAKENLLDKGARVRPMTLPDIFVSHGDPKGQYDEAKLTAPHIVEEVFAALEMEKAKADDRKAEA